MAAAILQGYAAARLMERYPTRRRLLLTLSAVLSLGMLAYCKYADFLISGFNAVTGLSVPLLRMALPIGISFYTFRSSAMSSTCTGGRPGPAESH